MSPLLLATLGGLISFGSTSFGALLALLRFLQPPTQQWRLPIDFALGLMLSAVAFSLVGPTALDAVGGGHLEKLAPIMGGLVLGALVIAGLHRLAQRFQSSTVSSSQLLLALVLMVHNFPEGLASGAALAGLDGAQARTVLSSIALQNIPEGLLMVICLRALGASNALALAGGIGSGLIELLGGIGAGFLLSGTKDILPFLLASAGGAMLTSVFIELGEGAGLRARLLNRKFALGFLSIPLLNGVLTFVH